MEVAHALDVRPDSVGHAAQRLHAARQLRNLDDAVERIIRIQHNHAAVEAVGNVERIVAGDCHARGRLEGVRHAVILKSGDDAHNLRHVAAEQDDAVVAAVRQIHRAILRHAQVLRILERPQRLPIILEGSACN